MELARFKERKQLLKERSRDLYRRRTKAEDLLWLQLKAKRLDGFRFRCQHRIPPYYIVDFVCMKRQLVIELDGSFHDGREEYDARRTRFLKSLGYRVVRFKNEEVFNSIEEVLRLIRVCLDLPMLSKHPPKIEREKNNNWRNKVVALNNIGESEIF